MNFSGTYGNYLKQNAKDFQEDTNIQMKSMVIQSCDHYMHYSCLMGFVKSGKNLEQRPEMVHKLCPLCKTPVTYLLPPTNCLQDLTEEEIRKTPIVTSILEIILEQYEKVGVKAEMQWCALVELLASIACYKIRSSELNDFEDLSENSWEVIISLLHIIKSVAKPKGVSPKKTIEGLMTMMREGRELRQQVLEQDYLTHAGYFFLLILNGREMDDFKLSNATGVQIFFLRFHLWQIITKLNLSHNTFIYDKKALGELVQAQKATIKQLAYSWLAKTTYLKLVLFEPGSAEKVQTSLASLNSEGKFDALLELLGLSKNEYLDNFLESIGTISYSSEYVGFDEMIGLVKKNLAVLARNSMKMPAQLQTIFVPKEFEFIHLESDFMEMEKTHYKRKCKSCDTQVKGNILCLFCGEILCYKTNCCRDHGKGEEQIHANSCSGGTGIYLYFWSNEILLVCNDAYCGYPSPYRNKYNVSVNMSKQITFERVELNYAALYELKREYLKNRIYQNIIRIRGEIYCPYCMHSV
eukprot:TRINITY_DN16686_c0_g1_i7.p1 TRINITY_DN16686_c0_g1~~TRINITY_DN16686_c0_g1_i7.p1  ORF type:complete len:524 (-),score=124.79 TRINITY_DN16686_c0_g1_i7:108-1679(-)